MKKINKKKLRAHRYNIMLGIMFLIIILIVVVAFILNNIKHNERTEASNNDPNIINNENTNNHKETNFAGPASGVNDDFVVCIDPGHGGSDPGSMANGYLEADQTLELSLLIRDYLEEQGVSVIMTRTTDTYISLNDRVYYANSNDADILLSVHRNLYEGKERVYGIEAWIHSNEPKNAVSLSDYILDRLSEVEGTHIRGRRSGTAEDEDVNYIINRDSQMASLILEMGYISDKGDNELLLNHMEDYAEAIGLGIMDFMENYN